RPRGDGFEDRRRAALLPDEPRHSRGRSGRDDRERVHRADHEGIADGVRGRDESPDPASDGGLGRLMAAPPINLGENVSHSETMTPDRPGTHTKLGEVSSEFVAGLARRAGEPDFLVKRRAAAWAHCQDTPFPGRLEELWRRTDISGLKWDALAVEQEPRAVVRTTADLPAELRAQIGPPEERSALAVTLDTSVLLVERDEALAKLGVTIAPFAEAAKANPALVERLIGTTVRLNESRFTGLNAALQGGGVLVHVPAGVEVPKPIRILLSRSVPDLAMFPHVIVAVDKGAKASVIHEYFSA